MIIESSETLNFLFAMKSYSREKFVSNSFGVIDSTWNDFRPCKNNNYSSLVFAQIWRWISRVWFYSTLFQNFSASNQKKTVVVFTRTSMDFEPKSKFHLHQIDSNRYKYCSSRMKCSIEFKRLDRLVHWAELNDQTFVSRCMQRDEFNKNTKSVKTQWIFYSFSKKNAEKRKLIDY